MEQLRLAQRHKNTLQGFIQGLKDIYGEDLISIILYGSAASGEFVEKRSRLDLLVVLKNTDLEVLKKSSKLIRAFKLSNTLFVTEEYIAGSTDIFPIEFLDMRENHAVLYGKDVLKDIQVDTRNLRFQCEQELKAKLVTLRQAYLLLNGNAPALRDVLFASFGSIVHIARNVLRIRGKKPAYPKREALKELAAEFAIDLRIWERILSAKNKEVSLSGREIEPLFTGFVRGLESLVTIVDRL